MDHMGGLGGFSGGVRVRRAALSQRGKRALSLLKPDSDLEAIQRVHDDSEDLRQFARRFAKKRRPDRESVAKFELDKDTGQISVNIYDAQTGQLEIKLSPEEVAEGLKSLEQTGDNDRPLSSFFVDIKV